MKKNKFTKESKNTFYFKNTLDKKFLNNSDLLFLKKFSKSRICLHKNINSKVHEMIIFHKKGISIEPHFHQKAESLIMLSGKMEVKIFNSLGKIIDTFIMTEYKKGRLNTTFLYKFEKNVIHSQYFFEDSIFKEVSLGPFKNNNTMKAIF